MPNPRETLSGLSGLSRQTMDQIWEQVKANKAKLDACPYHDFLPNVVSTSRTDAYICKNCGGTIDQSAYHWHERGRRPKPE